MLSLDQCLNANRPLIFASTESEIELLEYIQSNFKKDNWYVYSTSIAGLCPLNDVLNKFQVKSNKASTTVDTFNDILTKRYTKDNNQYDKYIFLNYECYLNDSQNIRKVKDIMIRYHNDIHFTFSLIMVSRNVSIPAELERYGEAIYFGLPDENELKTKSDEISKNLNLKAKDKPDLEVLNNLKGMTLFEVEQSYLQSFYIHKKIDVKFIRNFKKSAIAKTDLLSILETNQTFESIGGMDNLKSWIKKSYGGWTVEGKKFGLPLLKGLLLVGLPGTGKSLIMKAIGNEWNLPVINFDPSNLFSSRVGDTESNMRRVLKIIENMAPAILAIDEIEKAFAGLQSSSFSDSGVTARVIGSFLIWMQECDKPIFTIATANNIQYLPPELINRFDETFFVNLPQFEERKDIFKIHINKLNRNPEKIDLSALSEKSKDLSGREIEQTLRESMYEAFHTNSDLNTQIILDVLNKKTNLLTTMAEQLKYLLEWVGWNEEKRDGIRARYASVPPSLDMSKVKSELDSIFKDIEGNG